MLVDISAASTVGSFANQYVRAGDTTFFVADDGVHGQELWKTDGTAAGTELVQDIGGRTGPNRRAYRAGRAGAVLRCTRFHGSQTSGSDGTAAGTRRHRLARLDPAELIRLPGRGLLFAGIGIPGPRALEERRHGRGTRQVKDIVSGANWSAPECVCGSWVTRCSSPPTTVLHGRELWKSDGTAAGTVLVADLRTEISRPRIRGIHPGRRPRLFFTARDPVHGQELWVERRHGGGTQLVADIWPGNSWTPTSGRRRPGTTSVVLAAFTPQRGPASGAVDGTAAGTHRVEERRINPRRAHRSVPVMRLISLPATGRSGPRALEERRHDGAHQL